MDDAVGGDDVLLVHHLDAVDGQTVPVAADLDVVALHGYVRAAGEDRLRALDGFQEVEFQEIWENKTTIYKDNDFIKARGGSFRWTAS